MNRRLLFIFALTLCVGGRIAAAQTVDEPTPLPSAPVAVALPPAGVVPANVTLDVTGAPATDADVLEAQIRAALDRVIRPTLRPGAFVRYGPFAPWPLLPLATGDRTAVGVTATITGDATVAPVTATTTVTINNVAVPAAPPRVLFLSDDPEYIATEGLVFRGDVAPNAAARLYYYHSDIGVPRDLDVVLTATTRSRVHLITSAAGPDLDVMTVGHTVTRDLLRYRMADAGAVVDVEPGKPLVVRHSLMLQGEVVAGAIDAQVVAGGPVSMSVVASPAGASPETALSGPRVPFDGHLRHGVFALDGFGALAQSYTVGGPDASVRYGDRAGAPHNVDPGDPGRDIGDYGVVHRITFTLANPTDAAQTVYLYEKPLGGPVRSTFVVDGRLRELGCARLSQPYWVATYQLPAHTTGASTTVTMTDGGSFYPLEYGVTATQPQPYTPVVGTPDGCSPNAPPFTADASQRR